jgi:hypothetical protein
MVAPVSKPPFHSGDRGTVAGAKGNLHVARLEQLAGAVARSPVGPPLGEDVASVVVRVDVNAQYRGARNRLEKPACAREQEEPASMHTPPFVVERTF